MKKYLAAFLIIAACNTNKSSNEKTTDATSVQKNITPASRSGCYVMQHNKDHAAMQLLVKDTVITGTLSYSLFEKDKNNGTLQGKINDSLLIADYTFQAEGMTSVREVVFKIKGDVLYEGYGAVIEKENKISFKNSKELEFQIFGFVKGDCE